MKKTYRLALTLIPSLITLATACGKKASHDDAGSGSNLASFTVAEFEPGKDQAAWDHMKVSLKPTQGNSITKELKKSDFTSGDLKDATLKVPYGKYTLSISFADAEDKVLYSECKEEKTKTHTIDKPVYEAKIEICEEGSDKSAGTTDIIKSGNVKITPTLRKTETSNQSGTGSEFKATKTCDPTVKNFKGTITGENKTQSLNVSGSCTPSLSCSSGTLSAVVIAGANTSRASVSFSSPEMCAKAKDAMNSILQTR